MTSRPAMRTFVRLAVVAALAIAPLSAGAAKPSPRFDAFPARAHVQQRVQAPRLLTEQDKQYGTTLRAAFRQPVNFAGHYVLTTIGCGASCVLVAAIDATTGRVAWLPFTICCWAAQIGEPLAFRRDSELLVIHGQRDERGSAGPHYYRLTGGHFIALR